jgi:hypothetical protein
VTLSEVQQVVQELCYASSSSDECLVKTRSSKVEIDRLLLSLREETNELAALRSQTGGRVKSAEERPVHVEDRSYAERLRDHYQSMRYHDQQQREEEEGEEEEEDADLALAEVLSKKGNDQTKTRCVSPICLFRSVNRL